MDDAGLCEMLVEFDTMSGYILRRTTEDGLTAQVNEREIRQIGKEARRISRVISLLCPDAAPVAPEDSSGELGYQEAPPHNPWRLQ